MTRGGQLYAYGCAGFGRAIGRRPHVLNDGLEVDAWLEIMEWRGTIDRMVAFFYNSLLSK